MDRPYLLGWDDAVDTGGTPRPDAVGEGIGAAPDASLLRGFIRDGPFVVWWDRPVASVVLSTLVGGSRFHDAELDGETTLLDGSHDLPGVDQGYRFHRVPDRDRFEAR